MAEELKYELIRSLGEGGFGKVWLARHKQTQELVALKIMHIPKEEQSDAKAHKRFMREIEIALLLKHPHVLPALDSGYMTYNGFQLPYLVSPYMPDGSLAELIRTAPPWEHWTLAQTADVILQAAQALEYMHTERKIVHQDVKPGNFLLRKEGNQESERVVHLFLCDFGISRWQTADLTSQVVGTPGYIAPEQVYGNIAETADQYALAVMAHLLLTGNIPVRNADDNTVFLPPSASNRERIPSDEIDEVILKGLALQPKQRYPSILAFAKALQSAITRPVSPYAARTEADPHAPKKSDQSPPPPVDQVFPPIPLDPPVKAYAPPLANEPLPIPQPLPTPTKPESTPLPLQTFRQLLRKELPALPNTLCWSRDGNSILCTFYNEAPVLIGRDGSIETLQVEPVRLACWAPDGRVLAMGTQSTIKGKTQSTIRLWNLDTPTERPLILLSKNYAIEGLDWSVQRQLAIWVENQLVVYTIPQRLPTTPQSLVSQTLARQDMYCGSTGALRWSPDGALLAAGTRNGAVVCWRANTQKILWEAPPSNQLVYSLAWSPDSTLLAVAFSNRRVAVWNVRKGQMLVEWQRLPIVPRTLSISTSQQLVVASNTGDLLLGKLNDPAPTTTHPGHWLAVWSPTRPELATLDAYQETVLTVWS